MATCNFDYRQFGSIKKQADFYVQSTLFHSYKMLLLQTFWMLPALDARAEIYIQGQVPPTSTLHYYFVAMEIIKVGCLTVFGFKLFTKL